MSFNNTKARLKASKYLIGKRLKSRLAVKVKKSLGWKVLLITNVVGWLMIILESGTYAFDG